MQELPSRKVSRDQVLSALKARIRVCIKYNVEGDVFYSFQLVNGGVYCCECSGAKVNPLKFLGTEFTEQEFIDKCLCHNTLVADSIHVSAYREYSLMSEEEEAAGNAHLEEVMRKGLSSSKVTMTVRKPVITNPGHLSFSLMQRMR